MRKKPGSDLLRREPCVLCGKSYAKVCLHSGRCTDCTSNDRIKHYNFTDKSYQDLLVEQEHRCAICKKDAYLVIDHDHTTDYVRGLLCAGCNTALGQFKDSIEVLTSAIDYLESARKQELASHLRKYEATGLESSPRAI